MDHQTFHSAWSFSQNSFRSCLSLSVSIGFQKPTCLKASNCPSFAILSRGSFSHTVLSSLIYLKMPGSHTKNPALIQFPSPLGFSKNDPTSFLSLIPSAPKRPLGCTAVTVASFSAALCAFKSSLIFTL